MFISGSRNNHVQLWGGNTPAPPCSNEVNLYFDTKNKISPHAERSAISSAPVRSSFNTSRLFCIEVEFDTVRVDSRSQKERTKSKTVTGRRSQFST